MELKKVVKMTLKVTGALAVATGVVAVGAVVGSGAAAGSMVEGFKAAGKTVKKILGEKEETETAQAEETKEEDIFEEGEIVVTSEMAEEPVVEETTAEVVAEKEETAEVATENTSVEA